jgi:ribonuclease Z
MLDRCQGFSRGLYANWFWHRQLQLVVDAGEGLSLALGTRVFSPSIVAITHGHSDHILGLPGFAGARRFGKGATDKPWTVVYPAGSRSLDGVRTMIGEQWRGVTFPITWTPIEPGGRLPIRGSFVLEAFAVTHVPGQPALGYRVIEPRRRLRPDFADLPEAEIAERARRDGRASLMEAYEHVVFAHSGDAMAIEPGLVRAADLLVHDATFLSAADRREPIHATSEEVFALASNAGVRALVVMHLSIRYDRADALVRLRAQRAASGFTGSCWWLDDGAFIPLAD